jgi:type I restriction enzyme S subunit
MVNEASSNTAKDGMPNLPKGWIWTDLKEISLKLQSGGTPSTKVKEYYENGTIPFVKIEDMVNSEKYLTTTITRITKEGLENSSAWIVPKNSLLYSMYASYGVPIITKIEVATNQAIIAYLTDDSLINSDFIYYYLISIKPTLKKNIRGTTQENLNANIVSNIPIALAPISEQHRIVTKIEELLTQLDAGAASLKKVQAQLKRYRQAVLKAAFEGRLTQKWREEHKGEIEPASELFNKISKSAKKKSKRKYDIPNSIEVDKQQGLPDEWVLTQIQEVGAVQLGRQRAPEHHHGLNMRPYLRVANVFENFIDISDVKTMNFTPEEYEIYHLEYGDILLNEGQSKELVGRPAMYRNEIPDVCFQNTLVRFRAYNGLIPEYALQLFISYLHNGQFLKIARQSTNIAHLGAERFSKSPFPLPPYLEQKEILSELDRNFSIITRINDDVTTGLRQAEILRQSILKRAFEGKLVPQDPNDEPVSILLELIKAKRARLAAEAKKGKALQPKSPKGKVRNAN